MDYLTQSSRREKLKREVEWQVGRITAVLYALVAMAVAIWLDDRAWQIGTLMILVVGVLILGVASRAIAKIIMAIVDYLKPLDYES